VPSANAGAGENTLTDVAATPGAIFVSGISADGALVERFTV
jgi:hypothetical protein